MRRLPPLLLLAASFTVALPLAFAQSKGRGRKEPEPPPVVVDAGAPPESEPAVVDAGAPYDGGPWTSPLTPRPEEFPQKGAAIPADYDRILADIAALRSRVATASDALFKSRLSISLRAGNGAGRVKKLRIALDEATVYTAQSGFRAEQATVVFDRALSPGRHVLTFDLESEDPRERSFTVSQISRMPLDVPRDHKVQVEARLEDDSGMGGSFPSSKKGNYDLRVRLRAEAKPVQ